MEQPVQQPFFSPSAFLSFLKANYFLTSTSVPETTKRTIQSTIPHLLSQNIPLPYELLFYMYLLTVSPSSGDSPYEPALTALSKLHHIENLSQIISASLVPANHIALPLNKDNILPLFTSAALEHPNETNIYLGLVKLIEFTSLQAQSHQTIATIPHILQQFKHESLLELQIVLIILKYFDGIELNDVSAYLLIFEMLLGKFDVKLQRAKDIPLLKWILTKMVAHNLPIDDDSNSNSTVNAVLKQFCVEFRNVLADNDTQFLSHVLPKTLVRLARENKLHLLSRHHCLKEGINDVYYYSKLPTQLKLSVLYFKLLCKVRKREYANCIALNSHKTNTFIDVYFVFVYLNKHSRGILNEKSPFNDIISRIELHEHVDVFQYRNNLYNPNKTNFLSTDFHTLNKYVERNVVHYEKVKFSVHNHNALVEYFNALALKNPSQIVFVETHSESNSYNAVDNDVVLKHASITCTPPKERKAKYHFQFKGLFVVDSSKTKHVFLYEKHAHKWYSPFHRRWEFHIQTLLPKDITAFTLVYYRRTSKLPCIDIYNNHANISALLPLGNEREFYWQVFTHIATINPSLLRQNTRIYYKMFDLNDSNNITSLCAFLEAECDLKHNERAKHLLLDVLINKHLSSRDSKERDGVVKEIETKWFVINSNTLLDKLKHILNRDASDVYSVNTYDISHLLWNVHYTYEHIGDDASRCAVPKLLPCYLCVMYMWHRLTNDEDKRLWENALKGISIAPKFTTASMNCLSSAFPFNNVNAISTSGIKKYWNETALKLIDEYKLKCLSEFMLFYIENANSADDALCGSFEVFVSSNKLLLSAINVHNEDTKCLIHLIYDYIVQFKKETTMHVYNGLVSKCFPGEDDAIQLTELQKLVVDDYVAELLCKATPGYPVEKLEYMMRFVLEEERLQEILITGLLRRKDSGDAFHKVVKHILLMVNQYIDNEKYVNVRYVVVYYLMYCKINKMKDRIESMSAMKYGANVHYVFMKMSKVNNVEDAFKGDEALLKESNSDSSSDMMSVSAIENEIKAIETKLNKKIFVFNHTQVNSTVNIDNNADVPLIVYNYQPLSLSSNANALTAKDKMCYVVHNNKQIGYRLKGIVLKPHNAYASREVVLVNNEHNSYWYSLHEKKWLSVVDSYLDSEKYSHIMKVYCLVDQSKSHSNLSFRDLPDQGSSPYFERNMKTTMKWLLNNAVIDVNTHTKQFINMFNLQYDRDYNDITSIEGVNYDDAKVKDVLNKITRIVQYRNLHKIQQIAD